MEKIRQIEAESSNVDNQERYSFTDIKTEGIFLSRSTRNGNIYSEVITLGNDGDINKNSIMDNAGRTILERTKSFGIKREGLDRLIKNIEIKFKHLHFNLSETDNSLTLTVENQIKKGVFVNWVNQGSNQWPEPRRVVHVSEDGQFAFFDGSMTGIPVDQLELPEADFVSAK